MDLNRICVALMFLAVFIGIACGNITNNTTAYGAETWIAPTNVSVYMTDLYATIHVKIKNNNNHVQYFKISQTYNANGNLNGTINWIITDKPGAVKMIDSVTPQLGGDWGWPIAAGETKTVTFQLKAVENGTEDPYIFVILNQAAIQNTYWPLIPDPGLYASWFQPNEIEILNPSLDLKYWKGTFSFALDSYDSHSVSGIIRAPIVPTDSKLIYSDPKATFTDKDLVINGKIAAWDVTLNPGQRKNYVYIYEWPSSSSSSSTGKSSVYIPKSSAASTSVPTKETGLPYGLFIIGGALAAGGLVYARFIR